MSPYQSQSHHQENGTLESLNTKKENALASQILRKENLNFKIESIKLAIIPNSQTVNKNLL